MGGDGQGSTGMTFEHEAGDHRGELVCDWHGVVGDRDTSLYLYDLAERDPQTGHHRMGYRFQHGDEVVFAGEDFGVPAHQAVDSDEAVRGLLGFLSLRPGDTDVEYFDSYTARQREWADAHGEELAFHADRHALGGAGEAPTMDAAVGVLEALCATADRSCARVDELTGSLRSAGLDGQTLAEVAAILDAADGMRTAASTALTGVRQRHGLMHEVVNATPQAADTDWYQH